MDKEHYSLTFIVMEHKNIISQTTIRFSTIVGKKKGETRMRIYAHGFIKEENIV